MSRKVSYSVQSSITEYCRLWCLTNVNFLSGLEEGSLRSQCQPGWDLVRAFVHAADCQLLVISTKRRRAERGSKFSVLSSYCGTHPTQEGSTLMTSSNPNFLPMTPPVQSTAFEGSSFNLWIWGKWKHSVHKQRDDNLISLGGFIHSFKRPCHVLCPPPMSCARTGTQWIKSPKRTNNKALAWGLGIFFFQCFIGYLFPHVHQYVKSVKLYFFHTEDKTCCSLFEFVFAK